MNRVILVLLLAVPRAALADAAADMELELDGAITEGAYGDAAFFVLRRLLARSGGS